MQSSTSLSRVTTVTASDRLARHLLARAGDTALTDGHASWEQPDILTASAFWRRLAEQLLLEPSSPLANRKLHSRVATLCRWEELLAETFAAQPLMQLAGAASTALDAWLLCREWRLDTETLASDPLEETRLLIAWGRRFEDECAARGRLPDYALPEAVLAALEQSDAARALLPSTVRLAGFLELSPLDQARWDALRAVGVSIERLHPPEADALPACLPCEDVHAEHAAAAAWTRELLLRNPAARIGIVVPDLGARRAGLKRELMEALVPAALSDANIPMPFNFSLGPPLAEQALVADALAILALAEPRLAFADVVRLCRSPYLAPEAEMPARLQLEANMRREGYAEFDITAWRALAARSSCPMFAEALERLRDDLRQAGREALPSEWARHFSAWLERFGWCRGRPLESDEYQAREAWHAQLSRLVELDAVLGRCGRQAAFSWLRRFVFETSFQPRAVDAPVQVLGLLEATGMRFDAVWVMGLNDDVLPAAPRPNPFLPATLQRARGMPQASAAREQIFARELFDGLRAAAPLLICSYPCRERDADLAPSPLLRGLAQMPAPALPARVSALWPHSARLETFQDEHGPSYRQEPGSRTRGGTALLQNQSHCPFRAFAIHRLDAGDWPTPEAGPDAMTRGLIVHRVLERLWREWRTRTELERLHANGELPRALRATIDSVLEEDRQRQRYRWRRSLIELERERLMGVLLRWFENVELPRPSFEVVETEGRRADGSETETRVPAGPLQLKGKLDRVDRLADGSELVIDYKTGDAPGRNDFFGERPRAPQLPAYVLARHAAGHALPSGIAVASLKAGKESLQGVMRASANTDPGIAGLVNVAKARDVDDWEAAVEQWKSTITRLGTEFAEGHAAVDPLRGACDYCHLATLCRIHGQAEAIAEDSDD